MTLANMREEVQPILSNANDAEAEKAAREIQVFREFVERSGLPIDPTTAQNRPPPEPDIRCVVAGEGPVAFELVELCNPELAKDIDDQIKRGTSAKFLMLDDPGPAALPRKLSNVYLADAPIELVCYTGRTAVPDDFSLNVLRDTTGNQGTHPLRRIWFLGEETCEVV
jgi:hypothetical protein